MDAARDTSRDAERARADARDRDLVARAIAGEVGAFDQLVEIHQDYLYGVAWRILGDRDAAADAVQEAVLSAWRNLHRLRGDVFRGWLTRITVNAATDILRVRKRRPADPYPDWEDDSWQPPTGPDASPERQAIARDQARLVADALARIGDDQRIAIVLYDVEGYDYGEIAARTGVSLGTVKSRIHRGRLALRDLLAGRTDLIER
ncbi:MAG: RNA polymerase sigma factor [Chloroflexota bacterium]